jgi:hypothetical protein
MMTFLEYYKLSQSEKKINLMDVGSLSKDKRTHRHEKSLAGVNQVNGKTKALNMVPDYVSAKKDDEINQCIRTGQDQILNPARADAIKREYNLNPTKEEPQKAIKDTNVYLVLDPTGNFKLIFKGEKYGNGQVFR